MLSLSQINHIVHSDLSTYGLQFSYRWAMPYWVFSGAVFVLAWVNISVPIIAAFYILKKSRLDACMYEQVSIRTLKDERDYDTTQPDEDDGQRHLSELAESQKKCSILRKESFDAANNRFVQDSFPLEKEIAGQEYEENVSGHRDEKETDSDQRKEASISIDVEER